MAKGFENFAKGSKLRQIWSHWSSDAVPDRKRGREGVKMIRYCYQREWHYFRWSKRATKINKESKWHVCCVCKIALAQFSIFAKRYDNDELEAEEVEDEQCD